MDWGREMGRLVVAVAVVGGIVRAGAVWAEQGSTHGRWRSPEELIQQGALAAPQPILQVNLRYDADTSPILALKALAIKQGYAPKSAPLTSGYVLSLHSAAGDNLSTLTFQIPNVIFDPPPQVGQAADGKPLVLRHVDFALTVPMVDGAVELHITDPQGQVIIQQSLRNVPVEHNLPNFRSFQHSNSSSSSSPSVSPEQVPSRYAWLLDLFTETAEAATTTNGALDVTFVGDNYSTAADLTTFHQNVDQVIASMLTYEPYASRASQILFHTVDNTTVDLGCVHDPTMDRLITCNNTTVTSVVNAAGAPYDKIIVLVNDPNYGGSGGAVAVSYNGSYEPLVAVHEFGHTFGLLLDEYNLYTTNGTFDNNTYANCYAGAPPDAAWTGLAASSDYNVGCKYPNWYRSSSCSLMMSLSCPYFNAVSQQLLNAQLDVYAGSISPALTFTASPTLVGSTGTSTFSWTGTNVTNCSASGGWNGTEPTSGSQAMRPTATTTYTLTCAGASSSVSQSLAVTVDTQPPSVSITSPSSGATVSGLVTVSAAASDNQAVSRVDFYKDASLVASDNTSPYSMTWNTTSETPGTHTLTAQAFDGAGNTSTSAPVAVTVQNVTDTQAPQVTILSPSAGSQISGKVTVSVSALDNVAVTSLALFIDGVLKATSTTGSLTFSWNTNGKAVSAGTHTLTAKASDAAGNVSTVSVTVSK